MILTAHQPVYIPWLGLFHKIYLAERFCLFDIAQYQTKDFNNRNKIKISTGNEIWLSVPVESSNHYEKKNCDIKIINDGWQRKHCKSIQLNYSKAPFYKEYSDPLFIIIQKKHEFLTDLNYELLLYFMSALGIKRSVVKASDYSFSGYKSDLVLDMCISLGATTYIFGSQGLNYADIRSFSEHKISVVFQEYTHPVYKQLHGQFIPYMSVIDLLFNEGPESLEILLGKNIRTL
ncbi:MAG TPA: WbqC family protein [Bacteroidales bacterium]|nr:WbqC family protein [Bacteroidales bacterium]